MDLATLRAKYDTIKSQATLHAEDLLDIPRRVVILTDLYRDSVGNHPFSQIAAHGALRPTPKDSCCGNGKSAPQAQPAPVAAGVIDPSAKALFFLITTTK